MVKELERYARHAIFPCTLGADYSMFFYQPRELKVASILKLMFCNSPLGS